MSDRWSC